MKKLFAIIFGCGLLFAISLIISLIPIQKIGDIISTYSNKYNITISTINSWNFRIFGVQATTNNFNVSTHIGKNKTKISGSGENFVYSFITNNISCDSLSFEIYLNSSDEINDLIDEINNNLKKTKYSIKVKNLTLTIFVKNQNEDKIYDELMFQNVELTSKKNKLTYSAKININTEKSLSFFASTDNLGTAMYNVNAKIESDNLSCYLYDAKNSGVLNCSIPNLLELAKDLDTKIEDEMYKKLLNKKISIKADITHENDNLKIKGRANINNDNGFFEYNSSTNLLSSNFENINFDSLVDDIKEEKDDINEIQEIKKNKEIMAMSGKENKIIKSLAKDNKKNDINYLHKTAILLLKLSNGFAINNKIDISKGVLNGVNIQNLTIDITKKPNDTQILINNIFVEYGNKNNATSTTDSNNHEINFSQYDNIKIQYNQGRIGNILITGSNIAEFIKLFNLKHFNQQLYSTSYIIGGEIKLYTNEITISPLTLIVDNKKIFQYESDTKYNFETQNLIRNKIIKINDIKFEDYFDLQILYKNIYNDFINFQQNEKQDAVFWKKLFDKHNSKTPQTDRKTTLSITNSSYYNAHINNLAILFDDKKEYTNIDIVSQSDFFNGEFLIDLRQQKERETITSKIKTSMLNLTSFKPIFNDFEKATSHSVEKVFFENQNYNIPSFIGLNGNLNIQVDNFILNNGKTIQNLFGSFTLKDGVFESKDFQFKYGNGDIFSNITLSLQNTPDLQIGLAASGINIDYLIDTPLDGYVSNQCKLTARGFNPYLFIHDMKGKCTMIVQNLYIPKFDLLNTSNYIITNGIKKGYNYGQLIGKNAMAFSQGKGELLLENGILKGDIAFARELISGSAEFEYNIDAKVITKLAGSFVMMVIREKLETPFAIYLPVACNGKPEEPECLVNWQQLEEVINSVSK